MSRLAAVVCLTFSVLACQHSENRYLDREVHAADVVGQWVATSATTELLRRDWNLKAKTDSGS